VSKAAAWIARHRKLIVAVIGTALTVAIQMGWTRNPYVSLAVLAATSLGVYSAPNRQPGQPQQPAPAARQDAYGIPQASPPEPPPLTPVTPPAPPPPERI
jgi:hypothetical protein